MSNKDRGTIKWNAIMLPEHVDMIKDVFMEEEQKEKPILDEQQNIEINVTLQYALQEDLTVQIKYFQHHKEHYVKGKILNANKIHGYLIIDDMNMTKIAFNDLLDVLIL